MPRNYTNTADIDKDFMFLNRSSDNTEAYNEMVSGEHYDISDSLGVHIPLGNSLFKIPKSGDSFKLVLVNHDDEKVIYYIDCSVMEDLCVDDKKATQVMLWRTAEVKYRQITSGFAETVFTNILLNEYNIVASDLHQTAQGRDFWIRQLGYAISENYYVYRYDFITCDMIRITDHEKVRTNELDLWGDAEEYQYVLALISNNKLD